MLLNALTCRIEKDGSNEAIDAQDTSHDNSNQLLHNAGRVHNPHRAQSDCALSSSIRSSEILQGGRQSKAVNIETGGRRRAR